MHTRMANYTPADKHQALCARTRTHTHTHTHTHLGVPCDSLSSQKDRRMVVMAISYTAKNISAMMKPVRMHTATGKMGLQARKQCAYVNTGEETWQYFHLARAGLCCRPTETNSKSAHARQKGARCSCKGGAGKCVLRVHMRGRKVHPTCAVHRGIKCEERTQMHG